MSWIFTPHKFNGFMRGMDTYTGWCMRCEKKFKSHNTKYLYYADGGCSWTADASGTETSTGS